MSQEEKFKFPKFKAKTWVICPVLGGSSFGWIDRISPEHMYTVMTGMTHNDRILGVFAETELRTPSADEMLELNAVLFPGEVNKEAEV